MFTILLSLSLIAPIDVSGISVVKHIPAKAAAAIVSEVNADEKEPLMGSKLAEGILIAVYMREESYFKRDAVGDGGASLGSLQLQRVGSDIAFDYKKAVHVWLVRAHAAVEYCEGKVGPGEELSSLVSGNCQHGHRLSRYRTSLALGFIEQAEKHADSMQEPSGSAEEAFLPKE